MVAFHEAVGASLGVTAVDQRALAVIAGAGSVSAGELAKEIGLTPGAVTGVVDRLGRAGLAQRAPDPDDRRRLVITAVRGAFGDAFAELDKAMGELTDHYSPAEQAVIADWVARTVEVLREQTRILVERGQRPS